MISIYINFIWYISILFRFDIESSLRNVQKSNSDTKASKTYPLYNSISRFVKRHRILSAERVEERGRARVPRGILHYLWTT